MRSRSRSSIRVASPAGTATSLCIVLGWLIPVVVIAVLAAWAIVVYNRLVRLRNRTDNAWSQVDVQLRKRYDLVPNLVETVNDALQHAPQPTQAGSGSSDSG